ncbi:DUF397 domain-containing protein [Haloactinomyces albus]|uniref:DUF397 domain-containing protein n=1 Tax=Haloactinomyces albus TaxID=1352928 RepID=A0AAE4CNG0_9ACTN|nr:DUF397 domain-containing protein [Haloactinomyces albus]MDR7303864.1 hypothetical protein [Haloactinomyces albus]
MNRHDQLREATFCKSSYSDHQGSCVEIAQTHDAVGLRDSKLTDSPVLAVSASHGRAFVQAVKQGRFS